MGQEYTNFQKRISDQSKANIPYSQECPNRHLYCEGFFSALNSTDIPVKFSTWIIDNGWECIYSEELSKRGWIDTSKHDVLTHGSDYHYTKLIKEHGKTTEELYELFKLDY